MNKTFYTFDDIAIIPRIKSTLESRSEVDLGTTYLKGAPIIGSPMDTVCNGQMAITLNEYGMMGIIHRFQTIQDQVKELKLFCNHSTKATVGVAVGVTGDYKSRLIKLLAVFEENPNSIENLIVCLDTANGFSNLMQNAINLIKEARSGHFLEKQIKIMAGNIASVEGYKFLDDLGVDFARVGIGGGSACSTSINTGIGGGLISILEEINYKKNFTKVVADGGIRHSGDVVKALAAGADYVMLGRLLAGFDESPGKVVKGIDGKQHKLFRGLASKSASEILNQIDNKTKFKNAEGIETYIDYKGSVREFLIEFIYGIKSGFSYVNARNIKEFKERFENNQAELVLNSNASFIERTPKI